MTRFAFIPLVLFCVLGCAASPPVAPQSSVQTVTYTNPLPVLVADPFVFEEEGTYYLYGTAARDGIYVWTSTNLVDWDLHGHAFQRSEDSWGTKHFWAPELIKHHGKYYLHFTAAQGEPLERRLVLAESDSPLGPFRQVKAPWFETDVNTIDSHVFRDDDGRLYLYSVQLDRPPTHRKFEIRVRDLSDDLTPAQESRLCVTPTESWEGDVVTEGPFVVRVGDTYVMTYSGRGYIDPDYAVGVATSKSPLGPWTKSPGGPVLKRVEGVSGPGHHCFAMSPDGKEMFIVYHVHQFLDRPGHPRVLAIDRVRIIDGDPPRVEVTGPTITPQPLPSGAR